MKRALLLLFVCAAIPLSALASDKTWVDLLQAGSEYVAVGYQLDYIDKTKCAMHAHMGSKDAYSKSKQDVNENIKDDAWASLIEAVRKAEPSLRAEVDEVSGQPTAFNCGKAKGQYDAVHKRARDEWGGALKRHDADRRVQEQTLDKAYPAWRQTKQSAEFKEWVKRQPPELQGLTRSSKAEDAITLLRAFHNAPPVKDRDYLTAEEYAEYQRRKNATNNGGCELVERANGELVCVMHTEPARCDTEASCLNEQCSNVASCKKVRTSFMFASKHLADCFIAELPGASNDVVAHAILRQCRGKYSGDLTFAEHPPKLPWIDYDNGDECVSKKAKGTASRVAAYQIKVACDYLYNGP